MNRRKFIGILSTGAIMTGLGIQNFKELKKTEKMPILFVGHGSPMNAIAENSFTRMLGLSAERIPKPQAILVVSAHWMTKGTWVTAMKQPKTIHDFYGFPQELYNIDYAAPGSSDVATEIQNLINEPKINLDEDSWGLDHGTWSVLRHMYPQADIPVLQLSLDLSKSPDYHFQIGQQLQKLREKGVLIIGSGNIIHNLRRIIWEENAKPFDWALEYDEWIKKNLIERNFKALIKDFASSQAGKLAVPTPDHYYPLLYILGAAEKSDDLKFEFEEFQNASISMRTLIFG
jgi:4,5-DOPA dioxygenase extradiol